VANYRNLIDRHNTIDKTNNVNQLFYNIPQAATGMQAGAEDRLTVDVAYYYWLRLTNVLTDEHRRHNDERQLDGRTNGLSDRLRSSA
jgi:hypothetical protein